MSTFALVVVLAFGAGPRQAEASPKANVVVTTTDIKSIVMAVGGDRIEVESLAAPSQDPHSLELKPNQLARLRTAALVIRIGLDHEPWLARMQTRAPVVDLSRNVRLLQTETPRLRVERRSHTHAFGNPHYWLDPENTPLMAAAIAQALGKLSPRDQAYFEANRIAFTKRLNERMRVWKQALAPHAGTRMVVMHDTWAYFADAFKLSVVAAAEPTPGVPPSPSELARLYARMREAKVRLLIADPNSNQALAQQAAQRGNARVVALVPSVGADPAAGDYFSLIDLNVDRLLKALR
jgi:ABC-type Zn uptake system ZnuABC Zn-binding protein ZnuA